MTLLLTHSLSFQGLALRGGVTKRGAWQLPCLPLSSLTYALLRSWLHCIRIGSTSKLLVHNHSVPGWYFCNVVVFKTLYILLTMLSRSMVIILVVSLSSFMYKS